MAEHDFLTTLGLYADPVFLQPLFCSEVCEAVRRSDQLPSPLPEFTRGQDLEECKTRPKIVCETTAGHLEVVENKLFEIIPDLEEIFQVKLTSVQSPYVGIYNVGDFMKKHVDVVGVEPTNDFGPSRIISIVIYLNDETDEMVEDSYSGGNLTFHELMTNKVFEKFGYPIKGEAGKLIAFPSTFTHEVTPVLRGTRYVVSSGYF